MTDDDDHKAAFARRLLQLMKDRGIHHAELARRADLPRNNISTYCNRRSLPTQDSLAKLAKALGVTPQELLPDYPSKLMRRGDPAGIVDLSMKTNVDDPSRAWLTVNRSVSTALAAKIVSMLVEEGAGGHAS